MRRWAAVAAVAVTMGAVASAWIGSNAPPGDSRDSDPLSPAPAAPPVVEAPATPARPEAGAPSAIGAAATASAARGAMAFQAWCNGCHPGGQAGNGPALWPRLTPLTPAQVRARIRAGDARERARFAALPESRLDDIIAYIEERQAAGQERRPSP
jgi:mono/diheme cytochrome c family protein